MDKYFKFEELCAKVLNEIGSKRYKEVLAQQSEEFKMGAMWGMSWAAIIASELPFYVSEGEE